MSRRSCTNLQDKRPGGTRQREVGAGDRDEWEDKQRCLAVSDRHPSADYWAVRVAVGRAGLGSGRRPDHIKRAVRRRNGPFRTCRGRKRQRRRPRQAARRSSQLQHEGRCQQQPARSAEPRRQCARWHGGACLARSAVVAQHRGREGGSGPAGECQPDGDWEKGGLGPQRLGMARGAATERTYRSIIRMRQQPIFKKYPIARARGAAELGNFKTYPYMGINRFLQILNFLKKRWWSVTSARGRYYTTQQPPTSTARAVHGSQPPALLLPPGPAPRRPAVQL